MSVASSEHGWDDTGFVFFEREQRVRFLLSDGGESCLVDDQYIEHRSDVVDWMVDAGEALRLERNTVHSAVSCFDEFFARRGCVDRGVWQLLASACMLVAAKCEETESDFSILSKLHALNYGMFPKLAMVRMEQELLRTLEWDVVRASAVQFIYYFMETGTVAAGAQLSFEQASVSGMFRRCSFSDKKCGDQLGGYVRHSSHDYVLLAESLRLADLALRAACVSLFYRPSVIAAACIVCANAHLPVTCSLNQRLFQFLSDAGDDVQPCAAAIGDLCRSQSASVAKLERLKSSQSPRSVMEIGECLDGTVAFEESISGPHGKKWNPTELGSSMENCICVSPHPSKRQRMNVPLPFTSLGYIREHLPPGWCETPKECAGIDVACSEELDDSL
ncbi:hypothetical protein F1559_002401 [Cyanidiococcus yangmingshanensis]|uniref:Uncharacterized protein n=1 Tax=Cyanidiococcus yangmingshanensis TaxID=2690220 RepID=A0A7J7IDW7_9RHOD|nr:hypothetical protein F1559_002401 [Cyanidiococcus yangmingshanensis]